MTVVDCDPLDLPFKEVLHWLPAGVHHGKWIIGDFNYARVEQGADVSRIPQELLTSGEGAPLSWDDLCYIAENIWQIHDAEFFCYIEDAIGEPILSISGYSLWAFASTNREVLKEICQRALDKGYMCRWE